MKAAALLFLIMLTGMPAMRGQSALDGFDPNANGAVRVVVVQLDGKILIGGDFTTLSPNGGAPVIRNRIARLNPDGTLDALFDPNANGTVYSIAVQTDGKILVGGAFNGVNSIGGQMRNRIARLDADHRPGGFVQPKRERQCSYNRGADGRQDPGGRRFQRSEQHRRCDA